MGCVTVVCAGVDTLHLWTRTALKPAIVQRLEAARAEAGAAGARPALVEVGGLELQVDARWKRALLLSSDLYALKLAVDGTAPGEATATVEVRALALWGKGWQAAAAAAVAALEAVVVGDADVQVSRCDVAVDFQGWTPRAEDATDFTCRARKRAAYHQRATDYDSPEWVRGEAARVQALARRLAGAASPGEAAEVLAVLHAAPAADTESAYHDGRHFSGFSWGRAGALSARLYDKTRELRDSGKGWTRAVWARAKGYDARRPVWRLEFQLRREALRTFEPSDVGEGNLGSWKECRRAVSVVWAWCAVRWLRHGRRTAESRTELSPQWRALVEAAQLLATPGEAPPDLERVCLKGALETVTAACAGYLATAAAQLAELAPSPTARPVSELLVEAVRAAHAYAAGRNRPHMDGLVAERRERIAARRAHIEGRKRRHAVAPEVVPFSEWGPRFREMAPYRSPSEARAAGQPSLTVTMTQREVGS